MPDIEVRQESTGIGRWDPFAEMDRLRRQVDEMWARWPAMPSPRQGQSMLEPLADIEENDEAWVVEVELPGVDKKDIDVEVAGRMLRITAERKERERKGVLRQKKRITGSFRYEFMLPTAFDESGISASLADGELTVRIPKAVPDQPHRIKIT